jgi:hypothetical protein
MTMSLISLQFVGIYLKIRVIGECLMTKLKPAGQDPTCIADSAESAPMADRAKSAPISRRDTRLPFPFRTLTAPFPLILPIIITMMGRHIRRKH